MTDQRGGELTVDFDVDPAFVATVDVDFVKGVLAAAILGEGIEEPVQMTVIVTGEDEIRALNAEHRGIDAATDVLSFPQDDFGDVQFVTPPGQPRQLGDVVICYPRVVTQAAEYGHSIRRELAYLAVHGTLHLLGYDHEGEEDRRRMRDREEKALVDVPRA